MALIFLWGCYIWPTTSDNCFPLLAVLLHSHENSESILNHQSQDSVNHEILNEIVKDEIQKDLGSQVDNLSLRL